MLKKQEIHRSPVSTLDIIEDDDHKTIDTKQPESEIISRKVEDIR
jgi:hypothetical protein